MDQAFLLDRIKQMLEYRGYTKIAKKGSGIRTIILAQEKNNNCIRPTGQLVLCLDLDPKYSAARVDSIKNAILETAEQYKLDEHSSIGAIFGFAKQDKRLTDIINTTKELKWPFEIFFSTDFIVDRTMSKLTKNYKLLVECNLPDAPMLKSTDIMVKYVGGRKGDHLQYETVEYGDTNALTRLVINKII